MDKIYIEIADRVAAVMRVDKKGYPVAFTEVMQNYRNLDWKATKIVIGSILGKRKRRPRKKKVSITQLELFLEMSLNELVKDARECEASLVVGIPENDL